MAAALPAPAGADGAYRDAGAHAMLARELQGADIEEFSAKFTTKIHDVKGVCCEGRFADTLRAHPGNSAYVSGQLPRGGSGDCSEATHDEYRPLGDTAHIAVHVRLGFGIRLGKVQGAHLAGEGPRSCCGGRGTGCRPGRAG